MDQIEAKTELQLLDEEMAALELRIKAIKKEQEAERKRVADAVKIVWQFTWKPVDPKEHHFEKVRPDAGVEIWRLQGHVLNEDECAAVGKDVTNANGGMNYFVNLLNGKIVCSTGGGSVFITRGDAFWGKGETREDRELDRDLCLARLEDFMLSNPGGGDVTHIILQQQYFRWS